VKGCGCPTEATPCFVSAPFGSSLRSAVWRKTANLCVSVAVRSTFLSFSAERAGEVVSNRVLSKASGKTYSRESSLRLSTSKTCGRSWEDSQSGTRYVSNVPGRGYCFVARRTRLDARKFDWATNQPPADMPAALRTQVIAESP